MAIYNTLPAISTVNVTTEFATTTNLNPNFPTLFSSNTRLKPINAPLGSRAYSGGNWKAESINFVRYRPNSIGYIQSSKPSSSSGVSSNNDDSYSTNTDGNSTNSFTLQIQTTDLIANLNTNFPTFHHEDGDDQNYCPIRYDLSGVTAGASITWHDSDWHAMPWGQFINQNLILTIRDTLVSVNGVTTANNTFTSVSSLLMEIQDNSNHSNVQLGNSSNTFRHNYYRKLYFLDSTTFTPINLTFGKVGNVLTCATIQDFIMVTSLFYSLSDVTLIDASSTSLLTKCGRIENFNTDNRTEFKYQFKFDTLTGTNPLVVISNIYSDKLDTPSVLTAVTPVVGINHVGLNKRYKFFGGQTLNLKQTIHNYLPYFNLGLDSSTIADVTTALNFEHTYNRTATQQYYGAKRVNKQASLLRTARSINYNTSNPANTNVLINNIKFRLNSRFDGVDDRIQLEYANNNGFAWIAQHNVFDLTNDEFFNRSGSDRHLQIGTFVKSFAEIAKEDTAFYNTYKNKVDLLCASIYNSVTDNNFVYASQFDWFYGTGWLSGLNNSTGQSSESQAESLLGVSGLIDWGVVSNNDFLRDWGLLIYSIEIDNFTRHRYVTHAEPLDDRYHANNMYDPDNNIVSLLARVGKAITYANALYFWAQNRTGREFVWGINWLPTIQEIQILARFLPAVADNLDLFYSKGRPLDFRQSNAGTIVTAANSILVDLNITGTSTQVTTPTKKIRTHVSATGNTLQWMVNHDGNNRSLMLENLVDGQEYDVISPNITGARVRIFTKTRYANDWSWHLRQEMIRATKQENIPAVLNNLKLASRSNTPVEFLFDPNTEDEPIATCIAFLGSQISDKAVINEANNLVDPTEFTFKSAFDAVTYQLVLTNTTTNTQVLSEVIDLNEFNQDTLTFDKSINGLTNGAYTITVQPKNINGTDIGVAEARSFTITNSTIQDNLNIAGGTSMLAFTIRII